MNEEILVLQEVYELKKQFEHILQRLNPSPYFSNEQKQLINDTIVVLSCISDSDENIENNDKIIIELLMPISIDNGNQNIYKQVRSFIQPEQLKYYSVGILNIARERNELPVVKDCIKYFEKLGKLYFEIVGSSEKKIIYFEEFIEALHNEFIVS